MPRITPSDRQRILLNLVTDLQHSVDRDSVLAHVLTAVTGDLDFPRAIVALLDDERSGFYPWMQHKKGLQAPTLLPFEAPARSDAGALLQDALAKRAPVYLDLGAPFDIARAYVLPLCWGTQCIGVLIVDLGQYAADAARRELLQAAGDHAAVAMGMMQTRHRRAKESAIQEERARLALDLHDTVSQSLFGLVYALQACLRMLPEDPGAIEPELRWALGTAEEVRKTIRETVRDLWPTELTADQFEADLRAYAANILGAAELDIEFDVRGDFSALSPPVRRSIYRIAQEALANVVQHAGAGESRICIDVHDGQVQFVVRDNGRGFDPQAILSQSYSKDHFGLRGIQERAAALGGTCRIYSQPDAGASIIIELPANVQNHHGAAQPFNPS